MDIKSGYLTTEFWAMVVNTLLNVAVVAGVVVSEEVRPLAALLVPLVAAGAGVVAYVLGRSWLKGKVRY